MANSVHIKLKAINEVLVEKRPLVDVSAKYGVSRQTLYLWVEKYKNNPQGERSALKNAFKKGTSHHKYLLFKIEKVVLDTIVKSPHLSLRELTSEVNKLNFNVSAHAVYNVLVKNNLQREELRTQYSKEKKRAKHTKACKISTFLRVKIVEEHVKKGVGVSELCRKFGITRPIFYLWFKKYNEEAKKGESANFEKALERGYKTGYESHKAVSAETKEKVLEIVRENPELSVHKLYDLVRRSGIVTAGHHAIQNILKRERLNTFSLRKIFSGIFAPKPSVYVAPIFEPEIPHYSWKHLLIPAKLLFITIKSNPKKGAPWGAASIFSLFLTFKIFAAIFTTPEQSPIGLFFSFIALMFGLFFLVYSMKYYVTILMVLKLAQSGPTLEVNSSNAGSAK